MYYTTKKQFRYYSKFRAKHPEIETSKNRLLKNKLWDDVATGLNRLDGPKRTADKWRRNLQRIDKRLNEKCTRTHRIEHNDIEPPASGEMSDKESSKLTHLDLGTLGAFESDLTVGEDFVVNPLEIFFKNEEQPTASFSKPNTLHSVTPISCRVIDKHPARPKPILHISNRTYDALKGKVKERDKSQSCAMIASMDGLINIIDEMITVMKNT